MMNNLSNKLFRMIIENLDLPERIKLRSVSRSWRLKIEQSLNYQKDLAICSYYLINNRWLNSTDLIDYRDDLIPYKHFLSLSLFPNLKRFKNKFMLNYDYLKILENFHYLEQLEFGILSFGDQMEPVRLSKLKVLSICSVHNVKREPLIFDTPNLKFICLGTEVINFINLLNYQSVQYLEFSGDKFGNSTKYQSAKIIQCNNFLDLNLATLLQLLNQPNLNEFHLNIDGLNCLTFNYQRIKELNHYYNILNIVQSRLRRNVAIFIEGVQVCLAIPFKDYDFSENALNLHHSMRSILNDKYPSVKQIDFKYWFKIVKEQSSFTEHFYSRYSSIQEVALIKPDCSIDPIIFLEILEGFNKLTYLVINCLGFNQEFYNKLSKLSSLTKSLAVLKIYDEINSFRSTRIDFDFVLKFEYLRHLTTNLITKDVLLGLLLQLEYPNFHIIHFDCDEFNAVLSIKRTHRDQFKFTIQVKNIRDQMEKNIFYKLQNLTFENLLTCFYQDKLLLRFLKHQFDLEHCI